MRPVLVKLVLVALVLSACGEAPLESIGDWSSRWINEPEVTTTVFVPTTRPLVVDTRELVWANDEIEVEIPDDPQTVVAAVFARRQGDRFIQASKEEIAAVLPDLEFPAAAPYGAEWISSQLVIESTGVLAMEPAVAFGIWSAEPYTRSRTVAQMVVLRVAIDEETAAELAEADESPSCARFADRSTTECAIMAIGERDVWLLIGSGGRTLIWFDGPYRYELFGRDFVSRDAIEAMVADTIPLADLLPADS